MSVDVRLVAVGKSFQGQDVLRGVDLHLPASSSTAIMGPSGSGKSTLLNIIAGLERPTTGEVLVGGRALRGLPQRELDAYRLHTVSYVFQFFHLLPTLTVLENVCLPAFEKFPRDKAGVRARALAMLERVGLGAARDLMPAQLSGGMQSRTALVRAIVSEPRLLLADEPTGNLDTATGQEILSLLAEFHEQSASTLVIVTHEERTARLARTRLHMQDGRLGP